MTLIKVRRGTAAAWTTANPVLASGEPAYETDTHRTKYGDGTTAWTALPYAASVAGSMFLNAKEIGAKGDGTTDDTTVLQAAIDSLTTAVLGYGGGVLFFPRGVYMTTGLVLKPGVTLTSFSANRKYIASSPNAVVVIKSITASTGWVIDTPATATSSVTVAGIAIQGYSNGSTGNGGIRLQDCSSSSFKGVSINNCDNQAILQSAGAACTFEDILVTNSLMNRTRGSVTGAIDLSGNDHFLTRIESNTGITNVTDANMYVNAFRLNATNCHITSCIAELSDQGWFVSGSDNKFAATRADRNFGHGWQITGSDNVFAACSSTDNSRLNTTVYDGWLVSGGGNQFAACSTRKNDGELYKYAFEDTVNNASVVARNGYTACQAKSWNLAPFATNGFLGSNVVLPAHPVRPVDTTAIPDVADTTFLVMSLYTTATTITDFSHGVVGQTIRILGDVDVTIANNSTIATNTGANKVLAANHIYTFTNYNGKWYEADSDTTTPPDVQVFTTSGTWTKPVGKTTARVYAIGGGAGGGSGREGAAGTVRCGGGGGGGGAKTYGELLQSDLTSTVTVTIGTGGAGATAPNTNDTNGNTGTVGVATTFGAYLRAGAGSGGVGGTNALGTGGVGSTGGSFQGGAGSTASTTGLVGANNATSTGPSGGSSGGGVTTADAVSAGGTAFPAGDYGTSSSVAGGTAAGGAGGAGLARTAGEALAGGGGSGGGSSITGAGGVGGAGGIYGGGGGGGGASLNGSASGAGGAGAAGIVVVVSV